MRTRRLVKNGVVFAALLALAVPAVIPSPALADVGANDIRTLHLIRLNCDDEAESFSDEVRMFINGNWVGSRNNMDGGDWWPFPWSPGAADLPWVIEFKEDNGWTIGITEITVADTGLGEIVKTYQGVQGTYYKYRFTYRVD